MYVTRPLSLYKQSPYALREAPPEGPGSGFLVVQEDEDESTATCCCGGGERVSFGQLPFLQDRRVIVYRGHRRETLYYYFIPVIGRPLSSSCYYVVLGQGSDRGLISTCSSDEDMSRCCFCHCVTDLAPRPFDHTNIYQQIRIVESRKSVFKFEAVAPHGYPTSSLRYGDFLSFSSTRKIPQLHEALGMNDTLRARLPDRDFRGRSSPSTVVGRWYCPFMFVQDRKLLLRKQVDQSPYYEMTLEQFWEEIHRCGTFGGGVDTSVNVVTCTGPTLQLHGESGEVVWVDKVVVERMRWEQERGGWEEQKGEVRLEDTNMARKSLFTCYVLVERFGLRRLDGTLLLTYDFRHTNKLEIKWE